MVQGEDPVPVGYICQERGAPMLELCVKVININPEEGHEILDRCGILREYSEFVEILRKTSADLDTAQMHIKMP